MCKDDPEEARAEMDKVLAETKTPALPDGIDAGNLASPDAVENVEPTEKSEETDTAVKTVKPDETAQDVDGYTPVFSPMVRTVVYVLGVVIGLVSFIVLGIASDANWPHWVSTLAGLLGTGYGSIAAAFGVAYRPTR